MRYKLRFLPEVEDDAWDGYTWYEDKAAGLGEDFLRTFYACADDIVSSPFLWRKVHRDFRRHLLRRFPYAIYYRAEGDQIVVYGVFHCARDPKAIRATLRGRSQASDH